MTGLRAWGAAGRPPGDRWPGLFPGALMVTLGALALAKLGLLAHGALDPPPTVPAPALERPPTEAPLAPAAGPETPAPALTTAIRTPGPDAEAVATPATGPPPEAAVPALDPARLTAAEIEVLQQLAGRRATLDERARALDQRAALLAIATADLEVQIARLSRLRAEIAAAIEQHDAAEDARLASLVKIYEAMKPKAAADIFDRLEMPVLIQVVARMREPKSADVMARMDPVKAKQVTTELARRTKLLGAGRAGAPTAGEPATEG